MQNSTDNTKQSCKHNYNPWKLPTTIYRPHKFPFLARAYLIIYVGEIANGHTHKHSGHSPKTQRTDQLTY